MTSTIITADSDGSVATVPATRALLTCGAVAGPLYSVIGLAQAFTRDGFDLRRHPFSMLSLGDLGWIQIANFVLTGVLFVAAAVGLRRVLRRARGGTWGPLLVGAFGVGLIGGGVFVADPALGFPPGAPAGTPEALSWHGVLHGVAAGVGFLALIAACLVFTRRFAATGQRGWAGYSGATGVLFLAATVASVGWAGDSWANVLLAVAVVLGLGWASLVAARELARLPR